MNGVDKNLAPTLNWGDRLVFGCFGTFFGLMTGAMAAGLIAFASLGDLRPYSLVGLWAGSGTLAGMVYGEKVGDFVAYLLTFFGFILLCVLSFLPGSTLDAEMPEFDAECPGLVYGFWVVVMLSFLIVIHELL